MRVTFVHTSTLLNLRGSEMWLFDVCNLLREEAHFRVRVVDFGYDRGNLRSSAEISRRQQIINSSLRGIPVIQAGALRMRLPLQRWTAKGRLDRSVNSYLHFVPLDREFLRCLRDSDVIYYVQSQRSPTYLLTVLTCSLASGCKPVIAGIHVVPEITSLEGAFLRLFRRLGILRGIHVVDRTFESSFAKVGCPVEYIPNGIFYERFHSSLEGKLAQKEFKMIFVGAMTRVKGADLIPGIYDALIRRQLPLNLTICTSGGALTEEIRSWSKDRKEVDFLGFVDQRELAILYNKSSVAVFPSMREAWGLACVEAQASGTPVVASDVAGFRQTVVDGRTGFLVQDRDPESFAKTISDLYLLWKENRGEYVKICENAQENARENFQWNHVLSRLTGLIERAST